MMNNDSGLSILRYDHTKSPGVNQCCLLLVITRWGHVLIGEAWSFSANMVLEHLFQTMKKVQLNRCWLLFFLHLAILMCSPFNYLARCLNYRWGRERQMCTSSLDENAFSVHIWCMNPSAYYMGSNEYCMARVWGKSALCMRESRLLLVTLSYRLAG